MDRVVAQLTDRLAIIMGNQNRAQGNDHPEQFGDDEEVGEEYEEEVPCRRQ